MDPIQVWLIFNTLILGILGLISHFYLSIEAKREFKIKGYLKYHICLHCNKFDIKYEKESKWCYRCDNEDYIQIDLK